MTDNQTAAVRTDGVWKIFHQEAEEVQAVRDVSLTIGRGEFTALAGPSGSGKTTLLNLIGGLTRPSRGGVEVAGRDITAMSNQELARLRLDQVGFVFQAYNLLPVLTALENAEFPMLLQGVAADERRGRVHELFERTGMTGLEDRRPGKLSGGQQQRVAVVRAVASRPALVLADEPTANLRLDGERRVARRHGRSEPGARRDVRLRHARRPRHGAVPARRPDGRRQHRLGRDPGMTTRRARGLHVLRVPAAR